ncbi:hypothetical protein C8Q80DRAFT_1092893 [Daedaleopsis nitida]|nr:hypothetical protein C8Q80DRAFT_1092893 [Daedaleopsis nitida]
MSERGVGKPWTTVEDNLLIQAVAIHGENDNWKAVAASVPGRTNKACRKRWLHSLSPSVKKSAWTPEEDQLLLSLYATHNTKWSVIARHIPGRTDDACSKRYREALDPSLKRDDWTADEDAKLLDAYSRLGGKWGLIGQELNRSGLGCRNRWRMLERRRTALSREAAPRGDLSSSAPASSGTPSTSQWTPTHVQEQHFWDGRSPQYVTPSVLYQGSPFHSQEAHSTSYSPDQILSGVHLNGSPSTSRDPPPFQYPSSSLSAVLSHPNSVTQSPDPHGYHHPAAFPPGQGPSELPDIDVPGSGARSGSYEAHDYHQFISVDNNHNENSAPEASPHVDGTISALPASTTEHTGSSDSGVPPSTAIPSDSPASPSYCGSSPPGSPFSSSGDLPVEITVTGISTDPSCAPRPYYRTNAEKARSISASRRLNTHRPTRLSSMLPATTDATVLAYACGHADCWPAGALSSKSAFVTSKELSDHSKTEHNGNLGGNKPFRCGLTGCEKSWKSINGLQYHLQISKYHFQQALAGRTDDPDLAGTAVAAAHDVPTNATPLQGNHPSDSDSGSTPGTTDAEAMTTAAPARNEGAHAEKTAGEKKGAHAEKTAGEKKGKPKTHPCPRPGCGKKYKQLSGLRYHLTHGHVDTLPMQLDVVPPTLARMVAEKGSGPRH